MKNKEYIMVGAPIITKEIFRKVLIPLNNYSYKPSGGFYASEHISNIYNISPWFQYLRGKEGIAMYKNIKQSTIFTLKENTKILYIDTTEKVLELSEKYPSYHNILTHFDKLNKTNTIFDFEKISEDYDGIYISVRKFYNELGSVVFDSWNVNTLLLFNLDCIQEFRTAPIKFDINNRDSIPIIDEREIGPIRTIQEESFEHQTIIKAAENIYLELMEKNHTFYDYDEYLTIITQKTSQLIQIIKENYEKETIKILKYLQSEGIDIPKEHLTENFALNCLSRYLKKQQSKIKNLSPSKIKSPKSYSIYK